MSETAEAVALPRDTAKVPGRRILRFPSIDEAMAEVDRLAEAERDGRLGRLGNWTLGQTLGHLACWVEYSYIGTPMKVPFFVRWILKGRKRKFLNEPMRAGVRIPGVAGGTLATEPMTTEAGLARLRRAMERLKAEAPSKPQAIFGPMTHAGVGRRCTSGMPRCTWASWSPRRGRAGWTTTSAGSGPPKRRQIAAIRRRARRADRHGRRPPVRMGLPPIWAVFAAI